MSGPTDQFLGLLRGCREQRRHAVIIAVLNILYDINADKISCPYNCTEITMLYNLYAHYMQNHGVLSHYVLQQYIFKLHEGTITPLIYDCIACIDM